MKIKIIKMPFFSPYWGYEYLPPLSNASICSFLRAKGYDIVHEDLGVSPNHPHTEELLVEIREKFFRLFLDKQRFWRYLAGNPDSEFDAIVNTYLTKETFEGVDVLLISVHCSDFYSSAVGLLIARNFKLAGKNKPVIIGGESVHWPYLYKDFEFYNASGIIDYYVLDYGEEPLLQLLQKIEGKTTNLRDTPGLWYRQDGKIYAPTRGARPVLSLPDFDGFKLSSYTWNNAKFFSRLPGEGFADSSVLMLPVRMVYGCANRCAFCSSSGRNKLHYFKPEEAVENLCSLSKRYNTPYFFFMDDEVNLSDRYINDFCDKILEKGLKIYWTACASVKQIENKETLIKMRKAGACRLIFGLETASPRLLHFINKGIKAEDASRVLQWAAQAGIWTGVEIIAGLPYENEQDICFTADFIRNHRSYLNEVWLNRFYLCVHSDMFNFFQEFGIKNIANNYQFEEAVKIYMENYRYSFDETDGLSWDKKKQQIERSYNIIHKLILDCDLEPCVLLREKINVLFYLYTYLADKDKIRGYLKMYYDRLGLAKALR